MFNHNNFLKVSLPHITTKKNFQTDIKAWSNILFGFKSFNIQKMNPIRILVIMGIVFLVLGLFFVNNEVFVARKNDNAVVASHSNKFDANYNIVFEENKVHKIVVEFSPSIWEKMQLDLADKVGAGGPPPFGPGGPEGMEGPGGPRHPDGAGPPMSTPEKPNYFPATIHYNNLVWENVGVRYKGNSSLRARNGKLPLRIVMDKFEDDYPEIKNQCFYGFKELSFSSAYNDASLVREKVANDLFRGFGVPAVRTAFYEVYIDKGSGEEYYGVYTLCEVVFDTFLEDYFASETGNCYKPENEGANFAESGFTLDGFALKTNKKKDDKSDITKMYNYLHAATRNTNPAQWRQNLESVFDVDGFLKYLAVNNTIQNWDTYGRMPHNYYLYHDPKDGLFKWIVWDNNEAFQHGKHGGSLSFDMNEVDTDWPLINFIISDNKYYMTYKSYVKKFIESSFATTSMDSIYSNYTSLLQTSADAERFGFSFVNGQFNKAISEIKAHNIKRVDAAKAFVE